MRTEDYFNKHRPNFKPKGSFGRAWKGYACKLEKRILELEQKLASDGDLVDVSKSFSWDEVEEFGRKAFYKGREVERMNEHGQAIFQRPTYNGYLREIDAE